MVNRGQILSNELANNEYVDDSLGSGNTSGFIQVLKNYLELSVGKDTYIFTCLKRLPIKDTTLIKYPNNCGSLLQQWNIKWMIKNGKTQNSIKSTKTNSPTGYSGATNLPPIGTAFMYIETSSSNHGAKVFCSVERTNIIRITNTTFYYNRYSFLNINSLNSRGHFRIQFLLEDNTWSTRYKKPKKGRYSNSSTQWTLFSLIFDVEIYVN